MRRALVLAGGGARGAYQVGMLLELVIKQRLDFQVLRGVSVGALNAAFLAQASQGTSGKESLRNLQGQVRALRNLWRDEIKGNHSIYRDRAGFAGLALGADSLYSLKPLRGLIDKHLDLKELRAADRDFAVGTVSLPSGDYKEYTDKVDDFLRRIHASASIPVIFPMVNFKKDPDVLVDGGVRNITPLSSAFRAEPKPEEIYVLLTSRVLPKELGSGAVKPQSYDEWDDNFLGTKVSGIDALKRTVDILTDEIYLDDIRGALGWNKALDAIKRLERALDSQSNGPTVKSARVNLSKVIDKLKKSEVPIHVLAPREWYGIDNSATEFSPALITEAIKHGQEIAANPNRWLVK